MSSVSSYLMIQLHRWWAINPSILGVRHSAPYVTKSLFNDISINHKKLRGLCRLRSKHTYIKEERAHQALCVHNYLCVHTGTWCPESSLFCLGNKFTVLQMEVRVSTTFFDIVCYQYQLRLRVKVSKKSTKVIFTFTNKRFNTSLCYLCAVTNHTPSHILVSA